jgi:hypothetical protein
LVRIELLRDGPGGSEVLAKAEHRFMDAAPTRANLQFPVDRYLAVGDVLKLRVTQLDAGDKRYWLRLVLNAGNGERSSYLACPLRNGLLPVSPDHRTE